MQIFARSKANIINSDHVENIFMGSDRQSIKANMVSRSGTELARYDSESKTKYALEMLFLAMAANEPVFEFPHDIDLNVARQQRSSFSTKGNRHGGS